MYAFFVGDVIMIKVEREGIDRESAPAQGKDLGSNLDHPLLHILVLKGGIIVSTFSSIGHFDFHASSYFV